MHSSFNKCAALVSYGKAFLYSRNNIKVSSITNNIFQNINKLECIYGKKREFPNLFKQNFNIIAKDIESWLTFLQNKGVTQLYIFDILFNQNDRKKIPDYRAAAFINGTQPVIQAVYSSFSNKIELWVHSESFIENEDNKLSNSWYDKLTMVPCKKEIYIPILNIFNASQSLETALNEIINYCVKYKSGENWIKNHFEPALNLLNSINKIQVNENFPLLENYYSPEAIRLYEAGSKAWVFGAMGSWNDCFIGPSEEQDTISKMLYNAIIRACAAATNSFIVL